jgi:leucyl aminopeptidase
MVGKINLKQGKFPEKNEGLIYLTFETDLQKDKNLKKLPKNLLEKIEIRIVQQNLEKKEGETVTIDGGEDYQKITIIFAGKKEDFNLSKWQKLLADGLDHLRHEGIKKVTLFYQEEWGKDFFEIGKKLALAFYLTGYSFDHYKSKEALKKIKKIKGLELIFPPSINQEKMNQVKEGIEWGSLIAHGVYFSRDLGNHPASHLNPDTLVDEAFKIEKEAKGKIQVEVLDEKECRRLGMNAFLGVAKGSDHPPRFIVLKYQGKKNKDAKNICLIGKSITFDSGGLSLKPSEAMEWMKIDMAGGAAVLGVFKFLSLLAAQGPEDKLNVNVIGILPACENMPSGKALRPGDILTALNGKTIEVLNTDAEGRLTLADALSYAEKFIKPDYCIDLATLTGACMVALGEDITGLFGNDNQLIKKFEAVAKKENEKLWHLPLPKQYKTLLKSDTADMKNIAGRYGGAITAALFLEEFVDKMRWIHLDIAGPAFNQHQDKEMIKKGATGWGVVSLVEFIKNESN